MLITRNKYNWLSLALGTPLILVLFFVVAACATTQSTSTPVPPSTPMPPTAPTSAPIFTPTVQVPALASPVQPSSAPTRALPTATLIASGKPQSGGILKFAMARSFDNLDPAYSVGRGFRPVLFTVFNNLVRLEPDGTVVPELAKSWDISADGKIVTFHLVKGVKFHDGTSLDASAIKWNYDRFLDSAVGSPRKLDLVPPLEKVDALDSETIRFQLSQPTRTLLMNIALRAGHISSPTSVQKLNSYSDRRGDFGRKPVGSGPFELKEWIPDDHITLARNASYWETGKPYLDGMRLPFITDTQVIFAMLRTGEIDIMEELPTASIPIAKSNPGIQVVGGTGARVRDVWFRLSEEPWNNKALRQAVSYAMDRKTINDVLYQGLATPAYHPIGPIYGVWYDPSLKMYEFDLTKAKEKMAEAGYSKGFSYVQPCRSASSDIQWCELYQAMVAKIGIQMEIKPWESAAYFPDFVSGKHNGPVLSGLTPLIDPDLLLGGYFTTKGSFNVSYKTGYGSPAFDKLIDEAAGIYDVAKAKDKYNQALTLLMGDAVQVFQVYEPAFFGIRSNVRGFSVPPDLDTRLRDLWLDR